MPPRNSAIIPETIVFAKLCEKKNINYLKKKLLIIIAGPTAVGKTEVAIELAKKFSCPILSFDSRQFYKEMSIGTAKPSAEELSQAQHYFINSHSINENYTCGKFENEALEKLTEIFKDNDYCIAVGGSGLYINALCYGIDEIPTNAEIKNKLVERWQTEGLETLQKEVEQVDPEFFKSGDMKNPRRVIRALEVYQTSGKPFSYFRKNQSKLRNFETVWIGLNLEREKLNERINKRVDLMVERGLIEEVRHLFEKRDLKALNTVGYQEIFDFIDEKTSLDTAIELVKRNSRHYAKKQMVWFKKNSEIRWVKPNEIELMVSFINQKFL